MPTTLCSRPSGQAGGPRRPARLRVLAAGVLVLAACGEPTTDAGTAAQDLTLYTCLSDETVQPVIAAFEDSAPGASVDLFRAPTGELNARVAADVRSGGLRADVFWGCDPLTVQDLVDQGLVGGWTPPEADAIPAQFRTADYVGAHLLYMVAVHRTDVPAPATWADLPAAGRTVAVPDPSVAASALGALGWFAADPGYGLDFYQRLADAGAVQVRTPDEVTTGVAQGLYDLGMTTANSAYAAVDDGSPVAVAWPQPGAVAVYGPVALATASADSAVAQDFISFAVGPEGQQTIGASGSYPTRPGVTGPSVPAGAPVVHPDWTSIAADRDAVLGGYQRVFGG
ncbi:extracellular solute-binding protein [Modestobacter marinus]|uniref:extracellular solute-binding protein n=1 Tax=Modestobacter marinus TaxID=477641 RepID=UPI001C965688|nr:extracellular solute-binding protein [Modestobacter marinus]